MPNGSTRYIVCVLWQPLIWQRLLRWQHWFQIHFHGIVHCRDTEESTSPLLWKVSHSGSVSPREQAGVHTRLTACSPLFSVLLYYTHCSASCIKAAESFRDVCEHQPCLFKKWWLECLLWETRHVLFVTSMFVVKHSAHCVRLCPLSISHVWVWSRLFMSLCSLPPGGFSVALSTEWRASVTNAEC